MKKPQKIYEFYDQNGFASILALLITSLLLTIGTGMLAISNSELRNVREYQNGVAAQYLAEAGAKKAYLQVQTQTSVTSGEEFGDGKKYVVHKKDEGVISELTSIGIVNEARKEVFLQAALINPYIFSAYAGGNLDVRWATVDGSVGCNGTATIGSDHAERYANVTGNVNAGISIIVKQNGNVSGNKASPKTYSIPTFSRSTYEYSPYRVNVTTNSGVWAGPSKLYSEKVYFYNQPSPLSFLSANVTGPGIIYSTDCIEVKASKLKDVILISEKDIDLMSPSSAENVILIAAGDIQVYTVEYSGSVVAGGNVGIGALPDGEGHSQFKASDISWSLLRHSYLPKPTPAPNTYQVNYWKN